MQQAQAKRPQSRMGTAVRSPQVRAALSFPFRIGPASSDWRSRPFFGLAVVNNTSGAGDALVTVALAGSVFVSVSLNAARGRTALGLICTVLPFVVVGPFVGPAIDRLRGGRRFIIFLACGGRVAAALMMAAWIHSLLLFPAAFLSLVCSKTHTVTKASLVPAVVDSEEDLVRANSRLAVGSSLVTSIAAGIGGAIYKLFGSTVLLHLDALVFATCAALTLVMLKPAPTPLPLPAPPPAPELETGAAPAPAATGWPAGAPEPGCEPAPRPAGAGRWAGLGRSGPPPRVPRELRLVQIAMAGMRSMAGFMTALVIFGFRRDGAPLYWYGLVGAASIGGNFAGALLAPRLRRHVTERRLVGAAALLIAAVAIIVSFMAGDHRRPAAVILAAVVAIGASMAKTAFDAIVQRDTLDRDRSRLFARFESIFQLVWVVGALVPTLLSTPLLVGYVVIALVVIATSAVFVSGLAREHPARADRPAPV